MTESEVFTRLVETFLSFIRISVYTFASDKKTNDMKDIDIVLSYLKKYHYQPWVEGELEECKKLLSAMDKEKLRTVRHSRWMDKDNALYPTLFELFYKDELKEIIRHLNEMPTKELILELKNSKSSFKKEKIPEILLERYDSMADEERKSAFKILMRKGLVEKEC